MTKLQRSKYEMLARVRDFGAAILNAFAPESAGARAFARVARAAAAFEEQLMLRDQARSNSRKVKASTRNAVSEYMKIIAHTARQAERGEKGTNPFTMPNRRSTPAVLARAHQFLVNAKAREAKLIELGLPPTFIADFTAEVEGLQQAVDAQRSGRYGRRGAQEGIASALADGLTAIRELDVIVPNTFRKDPVRMGQWEGARHIDGVSRRPVIQNTGTPTAAQPSTGSASSSQPATTGGKNNTEAA